MNPRKLLLRTRRPTILFFSEAVTLAHVARPLLLAEALDPLRYNVQIAAHPRVSGMLDHECFGIHPLKSICPQQFLAALSKGNPIYDLPTLLEYVREDAALIRKLRPDVVIGDFRLSLGVSAALCKVPYINLTNAYWSPYVKQHIPIPELPATHAFGRTVSQTVFNLIQPLAFSWHARPLKALRAYFGLVPVQGDLRTAYTESDLTLYMDHPALFDMAPLPSHHRFIGAMTWSYPSADRSWASKLSAERPVVYVNLGSSGSLRALPIVIEALQRLPVTVLLATAGRLALREVPPNFIVRDYMDGALAMDLANAAITNGGSLTVYASIKAGIPLIGVVSNLDQHLSMQTLERAGAGLRLVPEHLTHRRVTAAITRVLHEPLFLQNSRALGRRISALDPQREFRRIVDGLFESVHRKTPREQTIYSPIDTGPHQHEAALRRKLT